MRFSNIMKLMRFDTDSPSALFSLTGFFYVTVNDYKSNFYYMSVNVASLILVIASTRIPSTIFEGPFKCGLKPDRKLKISTAEGTCLLTSAYVNVACVMCVC